jgi:hypothetical protein
MTNEETMEVQKACADAERGFRVQIDAVINQERRVYLTRLLNFLVEFKPPASTNQNRHGAFDGGLLVHAWMLFRVARSICEGGLLSEMRDLLATYGDPVIPDMAAAIYNMSHISRSSILTVALVHDFNKAATLSGEPYYIPKLLNSGIRSEKSPWQISENAGSPISEIIKQVSQGEATNNEWAMAFTEMEDGIQCREGIISLAVAEKVAPGILKNLSTEEKFAIAFHDGAYAGRTGLQNKESALMLVTHFADMFSSRWLS